VKAHGKVVGSGHGNELNTTSPIAIIIWWARLTARATTSLVRVGRWLNCVRFGCPERVDEKLELPSLRFLGEADYVGFVR